MLLPLWVSRIPSSPPSPMYKNRQGHFFLLKSLLNPSSHLFTWLICSELLKKLPDSCLHLPDHLLQVLAHTASRGPFLDHSSDLTENSQCLCLLPEYVQIPSPHAQNLSRPSHLCSLTSGQSHTYGSRNVAICIKFSEECLTPSKCPMSACHHCWFYCFYVHPCFIITYVMHSRTLIHFPMLFFLPEALLLPLFTSKPPLLILLISCTFLLCPVIIWSHLREIVMYFSVFIPHMYRKECINTYTCVFMYMCIYCRLSILNPKIEMLQNPKISEYQHKWEIPYLTLCDKSWSKYRCTKIWYKTTLQVLYKHHKCIWTINEFYV